MINFVDNQVNVSGSAAEVRRFINATRDASGTFKFNTLYCLPSGDGEAKGTWSVANWGCASDTIEPMDWEVSADGTEAGISFATAVYPPNQFLLKASKEYGVRFSAHYVCESGRFVGSMVVEDGKVVEFDHRDWERDFPPEMRSKYQLGFLEYWPFSALDTRPAFVQARDKS
jgi:hypothetical protein